MRDPTWILPIKKKENSKSYIYHRVDQHKTQQALNIFLCSASNDTSNMRLSTVLYHLNLFIVISFVSWSIAYGLHTGEIKNERETNDARRHKRFKKLRNHRHSALQTEHEIEVIMEKLWMNDLDRLREWIRAEVQKKIPCAWGINVLGETLNYYSVNNFVFPDFTSNYWVTAINVTGLSRSTIKLTGIPASARYWSLQTYTADDLFSSTVGALADVNTTLGDDGSYTILINDGKESRDPQVNSLQGLPDGLNNGIVVLMYRIYVPVTSPAGGVDLPLISIQQDDLNKGGRGGEMVVWDYCDVPQATIEIHDPVDYATKLQRERLPDRITYFRSPGWATRFPNNDISYCKYEIVIASLSFPSKPTT
jgi:hypothetical protein